MMPLYLADVAGHLRELVAGLAICSGVVLFFALLFREELTPDEDRKRLYNYAVGSLIVLSVLSLSLRVFIPHRETVLQIGGLVPIRKHHRDDCKHIIWVTKENAKKGCIQ